MEVGYGRREFPDGGRYEEKTIGERERDPDEDREITERFYPEEGINDRDVTESIPDWMENIVSVDGVRDILLFSKDDTV
jgi:hypothetical protein